jgi:hypothetical protein
MVMKSAVKSAQTAASFIAHPAESSGTADAVGGFVSVRVGANVSLVGLRTTGLTTNVDVACQIYPGTSSKEILEMSEEILNRWNV